uniref:Ig-like domain-containing protein n=1 Tax=Stegastes partitus TaxID=144197 RepID=A0A3B5B8U1_9TELE
MPGTCLGRPGPPGLLIGLLPGLGGWGWLSCGPGPCACCQQLTAVKDDESSLEGGTVTLTYKFSQTVSAGDYFFWYQQHPEKPPEFLINHFGTENKTTDGLSATVSGDKNQITLKISSAAVTDSAVYYCEYISYTNTTTGDAEIT